MKNLFCALNWNKCSEEMSVEKKCLGGKNLEMKFFGENVSLHCIEPAKMDPDNKPNASNHTLSNFTTSCAAFNNCSLNDIILSSVSWEERYIPGWI